MNADIDEEPTGMLTHSRCLVVWLNISLAVDGVGNLDRAGPPFNVPTAEVIERQAAMAAMAPGNKKRLVFMCPSYFNCCWRN